MNQSEDRPGRAAAWMLGAIASFSSMAVAGREVSVQLDTFELMMYRSLFGLMIVAAVLIAGFDRIPGTKHPRYRFSPGARAVRARWGVPPRTD